MKISVFGLGYVGSVTAACLARNDHDVIGVDVNQLKVQSINDGIGPFIEHQINDVIGTAVKCGKLKATISAEKVKPFNPDRIIHATSWEKLETLVENPEVPLSEEQTARIANHFGGSWHETIRNARQALVGEDGTH